MLFFIVIERCNIIGVILRYIMVAMYGVFKVFIYNNIIIIIYNFTIKIRDVNKRTNLGNIYFENTYIIMINNIKAKVT